MKKEILILNGEYAPGYKGGGPIQSCVNLVENLSDNYSFLVLCSDRDTGDQSAYPHVNVNKWNDVGNAKVFYSDKKMHSFLGLKKILSETDYDLLYLNGFFSPIYTFRVLILMGLGLVSKKNVILQPRGDFTGGCSNKKIKKYLYILLVKSMKLCDTFTWQATSEIEARDIKKIYPKANPYVIPNLPARYEKKDIKLVKKKNELRIVFISRIFPKKNLKFALQILCNVHEGRITFDIFGPMEDKQYWAECEEIIEKIGCNIRVNYRGEVKHNDIPHVFEQYHAFLFPTLGENYGHIIAEALMNNCLCILSKGVTPWDDYCELTNLGGNLPDASGFEESIKRLLSMDNSEYLALVSLTQQYICSRDEDKSTKEKYIKMFNDVLKGK